MSQAENRNTTIPTRRAVLAGAPAVAALAAGAATGGIATALAASGVDPVFAVVNEYKAAVQARSIVLDNEGNEEKYESKRAWDKAQQQAFDAEEDALDAILESEPATIAGIATVLEILGTNLYAEDYDGDAEPGETTLGLAYGSGGGPQAEAANDLMLRLAAALRTAAAAG